LAGLGPTKTNGFRFVGWNPSHRLFPVATRLEGDDSSLAHRERLVGAVVVRAGAMGSDAGSPEDDERAIAAGKDLFELGPKAKPGLPAKRPLARRSSLLAPNGTSRSCEGAERELADRRAQGRIKRG
jgi:hypothetical protein